MLVRRKLSGHFKRDNYRLMRKSLTVLAIVLSSLAALSLAQSSTADAAKVKGANTKLEGDRAEKGVWWLFVCTRLSVGQEQYVALDTGTKRGNAVLKTLNYSGSKVYKSKGWWPGKKMRCYSYYVDTTTLSKVKARWVRAFFKKSGKLPIGVQIGTATGKVRLNV